ncbi:hypothetical protein ABVN48_004551 [Salmonella enterica]
MSAIKQGRVKIDRKGYIERGDYTEAQYQALCFARGLGLLLKVAGVVAAAVLVFNVIGYLLVTYDVYGFSIPDGWLASNHAPWTRMVALTAYGAANVFYALIVIAFVFLIILYLYRACLSIGGYKKLKAKPGKTAEDARKGD